MCVLLGALMCYTYKDLSKFIVYICRIIVVQCYSRMYCMCVLQY